MVGLRHSIGCVERATVLLWLSPCYVVGVGVHGIMGSASYAASLVHRAWAGKSVPGCCNRALAGHSVPGCCKRHANPMSMCDEGAHYNARAGRKGWTDLNS